MLVHYLDLVKIRMHSALKSVYMYSKRLRMVTVIIIKMDIVKISIVNVLTHTHGGHDRSVYNSFKNKDIFEICFFIVDNYSNHAPGEILL